MESPPPPLIPKFKNKTLNHANLDQIWYLTQEWKKIVKLLIRFSTKKQLHRINFAFSTFIRHTISGLTNIQLHIFKKNYWGLNQLFIYTHGNSNVGRFQLLKNGHMKRGLILFFIINYFDLEFMQTIDLGRYFYLFQFVR